MACNDNDLGELDSILHGPILETVLCWGKPCECG